MKPSLAFLITNDLLNAGVIVGSASPTKVQDLVQARLQIDVRFRNKAIVHLARDAESMYPGAPCCAQIGDTVCTDNVAEVTCLKCLAGHGNSVRKTGIPPARTAGLIRRNGQGVEVLV